MTCLKVYQEMEEARPLDYKRDRIIFINLWGRGDPCLVFGNCGVGEIVGFYEGFGGNKTFMK